PRLWASHDGQRYAHSSVLLRLSGALSPLESSRHNRSLPRRLALGRAHAAMAGLRVEVAVAPGARGAHLGILLTRSTNSASDSRRSRIGILRASTVITTSSPRSSVFTRGMMPADTSVSGRTPA